MIPHSKPAIGPEEARAVARVLESGQIAQGREVAAFEEACAAFAGRRYAVAVNSGTAALHLALIGLGVKPGDRVAVPSYACAALAQAVRWAGADPVPCDVGADGNLDAACVPSDVSAVIAAHLFGVPAALPPHPAVVEDLAQSFGRPASPPTRVAITSFYATKMMTTGEGGMLLTDEEGIADEARDLRDYDRRDDFKTRYAYKMTDFQAAMGRVQLSRLPEFVERRAALAALYHEGLAGSPVLRPRMEGRVHYRYVIETPAREAMMTWLRELGVGASRPVHLPLHRLAGGTCPQADLRHERALSLPLYPALARREAEFVLQSALAFLERADGQRAGA
ncbi:MAG: DegT/DnrJ/EryC1/StrS aminotransferase family protein [Candidatus Hydrogenedentes bacterium]|nr:DegT/DnrJ/EryC1/StrS aminotransferase family protein [Candidatus Hydrogenedentota bacterium]